MKNAELERTLDQLVEEVPALLAREGEEINSCIFSTRIACGLLRNAGVPVEPLACRVIGMNETYRVATERLGRPPRNHSEGGAGAWSVEIGQPGFEGPGWNAHLVALVKGRYLLDLSIQQVRRPAKGIHADPFWLPVPPEFRRGGSVGFREPWSSTYLLYYALPNERSFLQAPAWRDFHVRGSAGRFVIERFRPRTAGNAISR